VSITGSRRTVRAPKASWEAGDAELSTDTVDKLGTQVDDTLARVHTPWTTLWKQPEHVRRSRA
jgi:hypothetical protein